MPNPADARARYVPRAWSFDDRKPAGDNRLRAGGRERRDGGPGSSRWRRRPPRGDVLAVVDGEQVSRAVLVVAGRLAELLGSTVRTVRVEAGAMVPQLVDACRGADIAAL